MGLDGTSSLPRAVGQAPLHPWGPLGGCLVTVHRITMLPWRLGVILLLVMRGQSADTQGDAVLTSEAGGRWGLWARLTAGTCPQHPPLHLPPPFPPLPLLTVIFPPPKKNHPGDLPGHGSPLSMPPAGRCWGKRFLVLVRRGCVSR